MKLLYTPTSPYSRKVRIAARELGLALELEQADPLAPQSTLGDHNPLGKVPTLITDDGEAVYDSPVILEYLDGLGARPRLHGHDGASRLGIQRLQALADGIMDATVVIRLESLRPPEKRIDPAHQLAKVTRGLDALASMRPLLEGELTAGSIAAACALGYLDLRLGSLDWRASHPALAQWYARVSERPSLRETAHPAS